MSEASLEMRTEGQLLGEHGPDRDARTNRPKLSGAIVANCGSLSIRLADCWPASPLESELSASFGRNCRVKK